LILDKKNRLFEKIFSIYNKRLLKHHFRKIYIDGEKTFNERDTSKPTILFGNHSNWWDGLVIFYLSYNRWKTDTYVMMEENQMKKYKFFSKIGAFSVDRESARNALKSISYSIDLLKNSSKILLMFPQGKMLPNDNRPIVFENGIGRIIKELKSVNVFPVCFRYEFLKEQLPEVFIKIGKRVTINNTDIKSITSDLRNILEYDLNELRDKIINNELTDFEIILKGRKSNSEIIDEFKFTKA
jgi:hypothetical protein